MRRNEQLKNYHTFTTMGVLGVAAHREQKRGETDSSHLFSPRDCPEGQ